MRHRLSKASLPSDAIGEAQQISAGFEDMDAAHATFDSYGVCTPDHRTQRKTVRQLKSSRKNYRVTKRPKKQEKIHLGSMQISPQQKNCHAIGNRGSNLVDIEIGGIDLAEPESRRTCSKSFRGLSARQEFMGYFPGDSSKMNPDSMRSRIPSSVSSAQSCRHNGYGSDQRCFVQKGLSARHKLMRYCPEASSMTNADTMSIRIPSSGSSAYSTPDDCCGSDQGVFVQKDNGDRDVQNNKPERIDEAVCVYRKERVLSNKIRPRIKKTVNERHSAPTCRKNKRSSCKKSSDFGKSFSPGKACHFTDQASQWSNVEDEFSDGIEIERIDAAEFRNTATHFKPNLRLATVKESTGSHSTTFSSDYEHCGTQSASSAALRLSLSSEDLDTDSNKSTSMEKKGNCDEDTDPDETAIEKIDESEFRNKRTHFALMKMGSTAMPEYESGETGIEKIDESEFRNKRTHFVMKMGSTAMPEYESDETGIEKIDESEFRDKRTHFVMKMGSTAMPEYESDDSVVDGVHQNTKFKHLSSLHDKNGDEADKVVTVYSENKSWESIKTLENMPSPSSYNRDGADTKKKFDEKSECSQQEHDEAERVSSFCPEDTSHQGSSTQNKDEMEVTKGDLGSSGNYDLCIMLADSILGRGPELDMNEGDEEAKQASAADQNRSTLPLKFRFEDVVSMQVEEMEDEEEIEALFSELDFACALDDLGSFEHGEADPDSNTILSQETQHARCSRGKHELVLQDEHGMLCWYCGHVELEPKDVLPDWAKAKSSGSGKKRYSETEQPFELDELNSHPSVGNLTDLSNTTEGTVWSITAGVRESLYEHQREGFEFLWKNLAGSIHLKELRTPNPDEVGGCIISHAPGTGKTRLTIVFIESYLKLFPDCRPVIVAPAGMLLTWEEEFKKWNVEFPFHNLNNLEFLNRENQAAFGLIPGANLKNKDILRMVKVHSWNKGRSILGISYSLFEKLAGKSYANEKTGNRRKGKIVDDKMEAMRTILLGRPGLVVLDEGHTPRNHKSNIWNALVKVQTDKRIILSGTPFQNNFAELFNTLRIVRPAVADKLARKRKFSEMINRNRASSKRKKHQAEHSQPPISDVIDQAVEQLKVHMSRFVHVHKGTILQQSLPGLRDCVVLLKPSLLQKSLIEKLEGTSSTFQFEHKVALISVHPYLFQHCDSAEEERIGIDMDAVEASKLNPNEGAKTKFILELVRLATFMNEKVLIFSQYIQPLNCSRNS